MRFEIIKKDSTTHARLGMLFTPHGIVRTPVFMPVATRAAIRALTIRDIEEIGFEIILSNTYHMYIRPGIELLAQAGGLHAFMNYHKPILTDSGGFQVFSLADLRKVHDEGVEFKSHIDGSKHFFSPQKVLDIQKIIGSDIMMVLDECVEYPASYHISKKAVERTIHWATVSYNYWHSNFDTDRQALFAIVQGSTYPDLRKLCTEALLEHDFSGYAIGGLSVGEPKADYAQITAMTVPLLPWNKPRYMMGVGSPLEILEAIQHGVDMFDCVMPTRIARNGTLFTSKGRVNIKSGIYARDFSPLDEDCQCYVCQTFTKAYLRHIYKMNEIAALIYNTYHNLFFMKKFIESIQKSIQEDTFLQEYKKWEAIYKNNDVNIKS
ncbi:MAG: tRNA guanosine(34) transglycosylase Tgt [Spirochaetes bacterium]|nr:tRNA guanosine(34) transglycosylase Tgt [Spirochaetota bacterium]